MPTAATLPVSSQPNARSELTRGRVSFKEETEITTDPSPTKPDVLYTESLVSWNTRHITPKGFDCQLTLRGEGDQEMLEANAAIANSNIALAK